MAPTAPMQHGARSISITLLTGCTVPFGKSTQSLQETGARSQRKGSPQHAWVAGPDPPLNRKEAVSREVSGHADGS